MGFTMREPDARAYASAIVDQLIDHGVVGENEVNRRETVRLVAQKLLEIFAEEES